MSKHSKVIFRKYDLIETPMIYSENKNGKTEKIIGDLNLNDIKHTYNPDENSITINREQELENNQVILQSFVHDETNIKEVYIEKDQQGEIWSYFLKREVDPSGAIKRIEGIKNHAEGLTYTYVNREFLKSYHSGKMILVNGMEYPEYCNTNVHGSTIFAVDSRLLYYHYHDHICEQDGRLLYYAVGIHEEEKNKSMSRKTVVKSIEYKEDGKSFRYEICDDTEPKQIKKLLKKLLKAENVSAIRIVGGEKDSEILIYGNEEKYLIAVKDDTGIRYARNGKFNTEFVQEFGLRIPQLCVVEYPVYINDFVENIICSDHGHKLMAWVYFFDEHLKIELPPLDFSQAVIMEFPKSKEKKPQIVYTGFEYKLDRFRQSLDEEKLAGMTARKMYNLAVKKLETGKLTYLSICAVCNGENEQNLILYGNGISFSVGIIDKIEETTLCYDNGSGDNAITSLSGQDFPNTMITKDLQLLKDIVKCFCDRCKLLDRVE